MEDEAFHTQLFLIHLKVDNTIFIEIIHFTVVFLHFHMIVYGTLPVEK